MAKERRFLYLPHASVVQSHLINYLSNEPFTPSQPSHYSCLSPWHYIHSPGHNSLPFALPAFSPVSSFHSLEIWLCLIPVQRPIWSHLCSCLPDNVWAPHSAHKILHGHPSHCLPCLLHPSLPAPTLSHSTQRPTPGHPLPAFVLVLLFFPLPWLAAVFAASALLRYVQGIFPKHPLGYFIF